MCKCLVNFTLCTFFSLQLLRHNWWCANFLKAIVNKSSLFSPHVSVRPSTEPTSPNMRCVRVRNVCLPSMVGRHPTIATSSCCSCPTYWSSFGWSTLAWPWSSAPWLGHLQATIGPRRSLRISHHVHSFHHSAGLSGQDTLRHGIHYFSSFIQS